MAAPDAPEELILWDVIEEHLDEATFLYTQFESLLDHPLLTRADVERSVTSRLIAHLDGLVLGGAPVAQRLLLPALSTLGEEGAARITVAAMALLLAGYDEAVRQALFQDPPELRAAVTRACALIPSETVASWALQEFRAASDAPARQAQLLTLCRHKIEARELLQCLSSKHPELLCAALSDLPAIADRTLAAAVGRLLHHAERRVRLAALLPALAAGLPSAKSVLRQLAHEPPGQADLMALHALLDPGPAFADLRAALLTTTHRQAALFALGYCGRAEAVPLLIDQLRQSLAGSPPLPMDAKLALQSIALLTGLDLNDTAYAQATPANNEEDAEEAALALPPFDKDDLDHSLLPLSDEALPLPNPDAVEQFWQKQAAQLTAGVHYLRGRALDTAGLEEAIQQSPLRVQHVLARALYVFTAGATRKDTRSLGISERAQPARAA